VKALTAIFNPLHTAATTALPHSSTNAPPTSTANWNALDLLWQGSDADIQSGLPPHQLAPAWQLMLLGDGSPTRYLQLLTGQPTEIELIDMSPIGTDCDRAPEQILQVPGPRVRRQVWLTNGGERTAYATSWWEQSHVDEYLENRSIPIWASLAKLRTELYRDVQGLYYGESTTLAEGFGHPGPFWGRHYLFWHHGQPLTMIYEVFSPRLENYIGRSSCPAQHKIAQHNIKDIKALRD
jgi:chorismate lyase